jgi:hypothetical protein
LGKYVIVQGEHLDDSQHNTENHANETRMVGGRRKQAESES